MEPPKGTKEYQRWYYETVTKPKRAIRNPDRKKRAPMRKLGEPTTRKCEYPACGKEFVSNKPEKHYCSGVCSTRHRFDIKHGIERKQDEEYCLGCEKIYLISEFPLSKASASGHYKYCFACNNELVRQINYKGYKEDPTRFREAQKRYNQRKRILTNASKVPWAGNEKKVKPPLAGEINQTENI